MAETGEKCSITSVPSDYNGSDNGTVFCPNCWKPMGAEPEDQDYVPGFFCQCGGEQSPVQPLTVVWPGVLSHA